MTVRIIVGDSQEKLAELEVGSVHTCVTSPPYFGLRDYGVHGQMGLEPTPEEYVAGMVAVFREVRRVLRDDGTLWLNIGDSYTGSGKVGNPDPGSSKQATNAGSQSVGCLYGVGKTARGAAITNVTRKNFDLGPKQLLGIPWRLAFALQADGWVLRQDIIWSKPNPMPESVRDRCTKAHEYLFLLSKSPRYYYDAEAIAEPVTASTVTRLGQNVEAQAGSDRVPGKSNGPMKAKPPRFGGKKYGDDKSDQNRTKSGNDYVVGNGERNRRSVWQVSTQPFREAHFATFPPALIEPCIKAGTSARGVCPNCSDPWVRVATASASGWAPSCVCYDDLYRAFPKPRSERKRRQRDSWPGRWGRVKVRPGETDWKVAPALVLDPFFGAGTTGLVTESLGRDCVGIELNGDFADMARRRIRADLGRVTSTAPEAQPDYGPLFGAAK